MRRGNAKLRFDDARATPPLVIPAKAGIHIPENKRSAGKSKSRHSGQPAGLSPESITTIASIWLAPTRAPE
jgi:hypothetical protein